MGLAVCFERILLHGGLFPGPGIPKMDPDTHIYDVKSRSHRRRFHAHKVGADGLKLCYFAADDITIGIDRDNDDRI